MGRENKAGGNVISEYKLSLFEIKALEAHRQRDDAFFYHHISAMQNIYVFVFIRDGRHKVIGFLLVCSLFIGGVWNFLLFVLRFFILNGVLRLILV